MITLDKPLSQLLRSSKPTYVSKGTGLLKASRTADHDLIIPPTNTNIDFASIAPHVQDVGLLRASSVPLPETWDWKHTYPTDSSDISAKKQFISDSGNQRLCGSCWAISTAHIISDIFVVSGYVKKNPSISTTYSLACYPQGQCLGGAPAALFKDIAAHGIPDDTCVDYSWCSKNPKCDGSALKHFDENDINQYIPSCGCFFDTPHYNYKIKELENISVTPQSSMDDLKYNIDAVKQHIYKYGSVLGGFIVFDNFMNGNFTKSNNGVYLENADYSTPGETHFTGRKPEFKGAHAVTIFGWGLAKNTQTSNTIFQDVPYWYCRNSWTNKWGDDGCFKMAMYPFNKISQFDKVVIVSSPEGQKGGGGILMCKAAGPPVIETIKKNNYKGQTEQDSTYYTTLPSVFTAPSFMSTSNYKFWLSVVLVFVIIGLLVRRKYLIY